MNRLVTLLVAAFCLGGCSEKKHPAKERFCTERYPEGNMEIKGTSLTKSLWPHSRNFPLNITVKFMNGSDFQKNKVRQYARIWNEVSAPGGKELHQKEHKINLLFVPYDVITSGNYADVRIWFGQGGSSSYVGIDCKNIPQDQPTMFFGWIDETETEESIRQVVLHEFGHALGLVHEHQHPAANIPWDKEKVYDYYRTTQNPPWSKAQVDANIFSRYNSVSTNSTAYDPNSIMHYSIPSDLTINGYSTPWNSQLSKLDSGFIRKIYPYSPCTVGGDCCFNKNGKPILCH